MSRKTLIFVGAIAVVVFLFAYEILWAPNVFEGDRFIIVSKGDSFAKVVSALDSAEIVRSRLLFVTAGRVLNLTAKMRIGKYRFTSGMSNQEILEDLRDGKTVELITVTIPEGLTAARDARLLARALGIDSLRYVSLVNDSEFAASLHLNVKNLEGYLMPDTYTLYWQTDEKEILRAQVQRLMEVFNDTLRARAESMGMSVDEVLTMASIVEQETSIDSERAIIAGVYYNRLKKRMRLQADPTVQYILEDGPRRLTYTDLRLESEYNTYLHNGLPPGPVSNPGRSAIRAALHPKKSRYLYFVANGYGGHTFSRTFEEHQKAIRQYRKVRAQQAAQKQES